MFDRTGQRAPWVWSYEEALKVARGMEEHGAYWLEEPLPRYDYERLAELNRLLAMPMAGAEANWGIHEFRWLLEQGSIVIAAGGGGTVERAPAHG